MSTTQPSAQAVEMSQVQEMDRIATLLDRVTDQTMRQEAERMLLDRAQAYHVRKRPGCANPDEVQMRIAAGRSFGLDRDTSLNGFDVIQGVVAMRASLRAALLQRHGWHWVFVKHDDKECSLIATKDGKPYLNADGKPHVFTYTMEDAKAGKLADKENWKMNKPDMLFARTITRVQRRVCPAATLGQDIPDTSEPVTLEMVMHETEQQRVTSKSASSLDALEAELTREPVAVANV
jgi:hypothetical protein